jgi:hypothetical protein
MAAVGYAPHVLVLVSDAYNNSYRGSLRLEQFNYLIKIIKINTRQKCCVVFMVHFAAVVNTKAAG